MKSLIKILLCLLIGVVLITSSFSVNIVNAENGDETEETEEVTEFTEEISETHDDDSLLEISDLNESQELSYDGDAYAVIPGEEVTEDNVTYFVSTGRMIFIRSKEKPVKEGGIYTITDIKGNEYSGKVFSGIENYQAKPDWLSFSSPFGYESKITHIYVAEGQAIKPISTTYWFANYTNLVEFNATGFDTSETVDMIGMFYNCSSLTSLDLKSFDTRNLKEITYSGLYKPQSMFTNCSSLESIELSSFDTSNITDMQGLFYNCSSLKSIDLSNFDTSNVTNMGGMFYNCSSLTSLDLSRFDTSSLTSVTYRPDHLRYEGMFQGCSSLVSLNLGAFDISEVDVLNYLFAGCSSLTGLDASHFNTSSAWDMSSMFSGCSSLISLDLSSFDTSNVRDMNNLFNGCSSLTSLNLSSFNTELVTDFNQMFLGCSSLPYLDLYSFTTKSTVYDEMNNMFKDCLSLKAIRLGQNWGCWGYGAELPSGTWCHGSLSLTETELKEQYPSHAWEWAGLWTYGEPLPEEKIHITYHANFNKDQIIERSAADNLMLLEKNLFIRSGYILSSWNTKADGTGKKYELGERIENNSDNLLTLTLYAQWIVKKQEFHFVSVIDNNGLDYSYDYNEGWFFSDTAKYNHYLACMSLRMSMASMAPDYYQTTDQNKVHVDSSNIVNLYKDLGFDEQTIYADYPEPEYNSIGYAIASKNVNYNNETITLVAIAVRSGGYGIEWGGNFNIGYLSDHNGFDQAAIKTLTGLRNYISDNHISGNIKVWISGYSRGAAVGNLLARYLDEGSIDGITNSDVFAYCFECPQNTRSSNAHNARFNNIFNIINPIDLVTKVAPSYFRYTRYGKDLILPSTLNIYGYKSDFSQRMVNKYSEIMNYNYNSSVSKRYADMLTKEIRGQSNVLDSLIDFVCKQVKSVNNYANKYQSNLMDITAKYLGKGNNQLNENMLKETLLCLANDVFGGKEVRLQLMRVMAEGAQAWSLFESVPTPNNKEQSTAFLAHYPELCLAWMESLKSDPAWNYSSSSVADPSSFDVNDSSDIYDVGNDEDFFDITESVFAPSTNRLILVNAAADVDLYDKDNNLIARIVDGEAAEIEDGLYSYIDLDGQRVFVVPDDCECRTEIKATHGSNITYTCIEQDYIQNEVNRVVSYAEVEAEEGAVLTGTVEDISDDDTVAEYELLKEGESLEPTYELEGDEIEHYTISLSAEGDGCAFGGGSYVSGEYAQFEVLDNEENFLGWYEEDELLSGESIYRFLVDSDREITARFSSYNYGESLTVSEDSITVLKGQNYKLDFILNPEEASRNNVYWSSGDESIAYVEQDGTVTAVSEGTTAITVSTKYGPNLVASCIVTVKTDEKAYGDILPEDRPVNPEDIPESLWYSASASSDEVYTGKAIKKSFRVYDNKTLLKEGKDYSVAYSNNTNVPVYSNKMPTITITGKGNYKNKDTLTFMILPKPLEDNDFIITGLNPVKYNGKVQKLKPTIKYNGKTLKSGTDYTLEYNDILDDREVYKDTGVYSITVKGKGNYSGIKTFEYAIVPAAQTFISKVAMTKPKDIVYTGVPVDEETFDIILKDKNNKERDGGILIKGTDYELSLSEDTVSVGKVDVTINGLGYYSGSRTTSFKITGIALSKTKVNSLASSFVYDGTEKVQDDIILTYQKDKKTPAVILEEGRDYDKSYLNNINKGTATLIISGRGLYTGTIKKTYKINPYDISTDTDHKISVIYPDTVVYSKAGSKGEVSVNYGDVKLIEGTDYTISYKNNTSVNDRSNPKKIPSFTIMGKGNFKGSLAGNEFSVEQRSLQENITMTAVDKVYSLKKNGWKSMPGLTDNGKKLVSGTDYDKNSIIFTYVSETTINNGTDIRQADDFVEPTDIIPAGTKIRVTVTGIKNYKDSLSCIYRITKADISKASVTILAKEYTGKPVTLTEDDITVKLNKQIVDPSNYEIDEVSYKNNINKGKASVTIKGINDLGSSKTVNYSIGAKLFQWWFNLWQ